MRRRTREHDRDHEARLPMGIDILIAITKPLNQTVSLLIPASEVASPLRMRLDNANTSPL
jgi:hypothetical protein